MLAHACSVQGTVRTLAVFSKLSRNPIKMIFGVHHLLDEVIKRSHDLFFIHWAEARAIAYWLFPLSVEDALNTFTFGGGHAHSLVVFSQGRNASFEIVGRMMGTMKWRVFSVVVRVWSAKSEIAVET